MAEAQAVSRQHSTVSEVQLAETGAPRSQQNGSVPRSADGQHRNRKEHTPEIQTLPGMTRLPEDLDLQGLAEKFPVRPRQVHYVKGVDYMADNAKQDRILVLTNDFVYICDKQGKIKVPWRLDQIREVYWQHLPGAKQKVRVLLKRYGPAIRPGDNEMQFFCTRDPRDNEVGMSDFVPTLCTVCDRLLGRRLKAHEIDTERNDFATACEEALAASNRIGDNMTLGPQAYAAVTDRALTLPGDIPRAQAGSAAPPPQDYMSDQSLMDPGDAAERREQLQRQRELANSTCPHCHTQRDESHHFCPGCGVWMRTDSWDQFRAPDCPARGAPLLHRIRRMKQALDSDTYGAAFGRPVDPVEAAQLPDGPVKNAVLQRQQETIASLREYVQLQAYHTQEQSAQLDDIQAALLDEVDSASDTTLMLGMSSGDEAAADDALAEQARRASLRGAGDASGAPGDDAGGYPEDVDEPDETRLAIVEHQNQVIKSLRGYISSLTEGSYVERLQRETAALERDVVRLRAWAKRKRRKERQRRRDLQGFVDLQLTGLRREITEVRGYPADRVAVVAALAAAAVEVVQEREERRRKRDEDLQRQLAEYRGQLEELEGHRRERVLELERAERGELDAQREGLGARRDSLLQQAPNSGAPQAPKSPALDQLHSAAGRQQQRSTRVEQYPLRSPRGSQKSPRRVAVPGSRGRLFRSASLSTDMSAKPMTELSSVSYCPRIRPMAAKGAAAAAAIVCVESVAVNFYRVPSPPPIGESPPPSPPVTPPPSAPLTPRPRSPRRPSPLLPEKEESSLAVADAAGERDSVSARLYLDEMPPQTPLRPLPRGVVQAVAVAVAATVAATVARRAACRGFSGPLTAPRDPFGVCGVRWVAPHSCSSPAPSSQASPRQRWPPRLRPAPRGPPQYLAERQPAGGGPYLSVHAASTCSTPAYGSARRRGGQPAPSWHERELSPPFPTQGRFADDLRWRGS